MIIVREKGLASLANAFARPVDGRGHGLVVNSLEALSGYRGKLKTMYGDTGVRSTNYATTEDVNLNDLGTKAGSVHDLLTKAMSDLGGA
jgi:hypothetical protein